MKTKEAITDRQDSLQKSYKMRRIVLGRNHVVVAMPYEVIEREARKRNLDVDTFLRTHQVICEYDNFDGVHYTFEEVEVGK